MKKESPVVLPPQIETVMRYLNNGQLKDFKTTLSKDGFFTFIACTIDERHDVQIKLSPHLGRVYMDREELIRKIMELRALKRTQVEVAQTLSISQALVSRYEKEIKARLRQEAAKKTAGGRS